MKKFYERYKHAIPLIVYAFIYLSWFSYLERTVQNPQTIIHMKWDDMIPFCEVFVIPYYLWFGYVSIVVLYLLFKNKQDYYRACTFLFTGMTIFLLVSTLWPSIHVYNSIGAHLAVTHNEKLRKNKVIYFGSLILCISIILSTVFIKQHSCFDVITGILMGAIMYVIVYQLDIISIYQTRQAARRQRMREV